MAHRTYTTLNCTCTSSHVVTSEHPFTPGQFPIHSASPFPQGYTYLGNEFIVVRQMRSAVDAAVPPVTLVRNKILELSFAHGHRLAAKLYSNSSLRHTIVARRKRFFLVTYCV